MRRISRKLRICFRLKWERSNDLMPDPDNDEWVGEGSYEVTRRELRFGH